VRCIDEFVIVVVVYSVTGNGGEEGGEEREKTRLDAYVAVIGADQDGSPQGER
jgi:hypothetical protein